MRRFEHLDSADFRLTEDRPRVTRSACHRQGRTRCPRHRNRQARRPDGAGAIDHVEGRIVEESPPVRRRLLNNANGR